MPVNKKLDAKLKTIAAKVSDILEREKISEDMRTDLMAIGAAIDSYRRTAKPATASSDAVVSQSAA